ncbi:MAG: SDR family oxidoreductase [Planctomycetaceae bacterium]|jgi:NAD(P)-dependent dehydrogenase (short-subunit alcohol dehydrogenase family)|nr:SDR family oxidoreductase [Planctomycetaceae bacterium]
MTAAPLLASRVVIITGAARGLGRAIALGCAASGAKVVLADRDAAEVEAAAAAIAGAGGEAVSVPTDVSRLEDLERLCTATVSRFGRIDGLVNNAGVNFVKPVLEVTEEEWDRVIDVDLKAAFFLTQFVARRMVAQRPAGGAIVQIASVHTIAAVAGAAPYDAAKHGMVGFTKAAAVELAPHGVRINLLSPGLCRTAIWQHVVAAAPSEQACLDYWWSQIPGRRLIEPEEIADAAVFLLSDAARAFTGANLLADLGMTSLLVGREPYASRPITGA